MKRYIVFIILFLIFLGSIGIGYFYLESQEEKNKVVRSDDMTLEANTVENELLSTQTSTNEVIIEESEEKASDKYVIGEENGFVNIYIIDDDGESVLYDVTNICLDYLPEETQKKIETNIEVRGKEELNSILENLES